MDQCERMESSATGAVEKDLGKVFSRNQNRTRR